MLSIQDTSTWPQSGDPRCLCLPRGRGHTRTCKSRVGSSSPSSPLQISTFPPPPPPRQRCSPVDGSPAPPKRTLNRGWELLAPLRPFQRRAPAPLQPCSPPAGQAPTAPSPIFLVGVASSAAAGHTDKCRGGKGWRPHPSLPAPCWCRGGVGELGQAPVPPPQPRRGSPEQKTTGNRAAGGGEACPEGKEGEKGTRRGGSGCFQPPAQLSKRPPQLVPKGKGWRGGGVAFSSSTNVLTKS